EKQKAYNAALAEQKDARSGYLPKVIFTGDIGYKHYRDSGTGYESENDGFYDARVTVSQLLYDWDKTSSFVAARKNHMLAALYAYINEASQVSFDTIVAYLNVLKYQELRELAMQNVVTHENLLENIRMQVERGKKGRSELERINGRMASAQSRLLLSRNDYKKAVYTLHKLLGRFTPVNEMTMPQLDTGELPGSLREALDLQVRFNPQLREIFYSTARKRYEYQSKKSEHLGRLSLEGSANIENEFDDSDQYETDARIALRYRLPLFDSGLSHQVRAASSQVHRQQQEGYRLRRTLLHDIQLTWAAHKMLEEQIAVLKKNLYFTRRSLESYKEEFVLGRRSLINILDAQNEHQHVNEQLVDAIYSREMEKYRILLAEGVLLSKLGLLNPLAQRMINEDDNYVPFSNDDLPLNHDFDQDGVADDRDVSVNNLKDTRVNELGIDQGYDSSYIFATVVGNAKEAENVIGRKDSLAKKPMRLNTTTVFDFNAFLPGGAALTDTMSQKMMKQLVKQARSYSVQTPLYIRVSTNEYDDANENYNLSIQRAYTLKRILLHHKLDDKGVFVFADTNAPKGRNILRMKFTDKLAEYRNQYQTYSVTDQIFARRANRIANVQKLDEIIAGISQHPGKVDIILYSNEHSSKEANRQLDLKRSFLLADYLAGKGIGADKVTVFSWGSFAEDPLEPVSRQGRQLLQYVLRKPDNR
ncbi:MAG: hypothetical protein CSB48_08840, partial [Proteobacteria bacterium]